MPRHLRLPLILAVLAVGAVALGIRSGTSVHQRVASGRGDAAIATPVLSARRVPTMTSAGIAQRRLVAAVGPRAATVQGSFCFTAAANGRQLIDVSPDAPLMPGSNLKLATAFAALRRLGPEAVLHTVVAAAAKPDASGTVSGDLYFVGGGDPLISTANYVATSKYGAYPYTSLDSIADRVVAAGVTHVEGAVVGDDSRYDSLRTVPSWPDRYVADNQVGPLSALSVNDAKTYPVVAGGGGTPRPAPDPPAYAASALTELLRARGVVIDGAPAAGRAPTRRTTLVDVPSLTVREIVAQMLTFSDNNTAELMLKELGRSDQEPGSTERGIAAVADELRTAGLPTDGFVQTDGSGLDRGDRTTCRLLQAVLTESGPDEGVSSDLAVAGTSGTLRDRLRDPAVRGRIRAKTGTLRDVTALSGWAEGTADTDIAFSFVLNTGGRQVSAADLRVQEQLVSALVSYPDTPDPSLLGPLPPERS